MKSLLDISIQYFAFLLEDSRYADILWSKIIVENFYFTPYITNSLLSLLAKNNVLSDKYFSIFSSPIIFPFTKLSVEKDQGASNISILTLIRYLEKHFIKNLEYLKLSQVSFIPFEDLISFFFLQKPQILSDHYDKIQSYHDVISLKYLQPEQNFFNITHLDLSGNNFSTAKKLFAPLTKNKFSLLPGQEVDSEIDFYFYFKNKAKSSALKTKSPLKNILKVLEDDEGLLEGDEMEFTFNLPQSLEEFKCIDTMLPNLVYLNLSDSLLLTPKTMSLILQHLPMLETLDLSSCINLDSFDFLITNPCKDTLKTLVLHGLRISCLENTPETLTKLSNLENLDISEPSGKHYHLDVPNVTFPGTTNNGRWRNLSEIAENVENQRQQLITDPSNSTTTTNSDTNNDNNNRNNDDEDNIDYASTADNFDAFSLIPMRTPVHLIISSRNFPKLKKIDLSGVAGLSPISLLSFLELHPDLEFLGLMLSHVNYDPRVSDYFANHKNLTVAGECTEQQLVNALKWYSERHGYVQKALQRLFSFTRDVREPDHVLIQTIADHMAANPLHIGINLAGTACLYNLVKIPNIGNFVSLELAKYVVATCLDTMTNFNTNQQLQKNVILLLCNDWIINHVEFDRLRCTCLVLDCLSAYKDNRMIQMCAAITSLIAAKMKVDEINQLGSRCQYIRRLLEIILEKVLNYQHDSVLKLCLSAIWNLTDESPQTCINFIKANGLRVYYEAFQSFSDDPSILTKFLGSLSNVAEVEQLKSAFLKRPGFTRRLFELAEFSTTTSPIRNTNMNNTNNSTTSNATAISNANLVSVSYFACGICSHLLSCAEEEDEGGDEEGGGGGGGDIEEMDNNGHLASSSCKAFHDNQMDTTDSRPPPVTSTLTLNSDSSEWSHERNVSRRPSNNNSSSMENTSVSSESVSLQAPLNPRVYSLRRRRRQHPPRDGLPPTKKDINELLCRVVLSWPDLNVEMVSYRSFKPFFTLLRSSFAQNFGAHIWAVWAMRHVSSKNPERYTMLFIKEGGARFLRGYRDNLNTMFIKPTSPGDRKIMVKDSNNSSFIHELPFRTGISPNLDLVDRKVCAKDLSVATNFVNAQNDLGNTSEGASAQTIELYKYEIDNTDNPTTSSGYYSSANNLIPKLSVYARHQTSSPFEPYNLLRPILDDLFNIVYSNMEKYQDEINKLKLT